MQYHDRLLRVKMLEMQDLDSNAASYTACWLVVAPAFMFDLLLALCSGCRFMNKS